jgi:hypothetical protein
MGQLFRSWSCPAAWITLALLLLIALPLFVCMPVWIDASLYDLAARNVLRGGVPYRDLFDTNLPGMLWAHLAVRGLFGWSTEALRLVDIFLFAISVYFLTRFLRGARSVCVGNPDSLAYASGSALPIWFAVVCFIFYLSTTEWCHCQRDPWMLPFALGALLLRRRQMDSLADATVSSRRLALRSGMEGICWGAAFWIKPFVAVPAVVCWALCALDNKKAGKRLLVDGASLFAGGIIAGIPGIIWLIASGAWAPMWDIFLDWNREYVAARYPVRHRAKLMFSRLSPWGSLHVVAIPVAMWLIVWALRTGFNPTSMHPEASKPDVRHRRRYVLLAGFYLGWVAQVVFLQKTYDYSLAPLPPLALTLLLAVVWRRTAGYLRWSAVAVFGLFVLVPNPMPLIRHPAIVVQNPRTLLRFPLLNPDRLALWVRCWMEGSTAEVRDDLKLLPWERPSPNWTQLERVRSFLREQGVQDGELTCYHTTTHPLYLQMNYRPTTPYLHFDMILANFPRHREVIRKQLAESGQGYVVSDLAAVALNLTPAQTIAEPSDALPADFPNQWRDVFPWTEPILFRAGRYVVHRVTSPVVRLFPDKPRTSADQAAEGKRLTP